MHILIVTQYFHPERFIINDVTADLVRRGHKVTVYTGMPNYPAGKFFEGYGGFCPRRETVNGADVIRVPMIARGKRSVQLVLNYLSYALSASVLAPFLLPKSVDAILVYEPSPVTVGIPAIVAKWLRGAPMLFWVQDLWPETLRAAKVTSNRLVLGAVSVLVRFIYRRCDIILAQSNAFIDHIRRMVSSADIRYLPNPASGSSYLPEGSSADAEERHLIPDGFNVLIAGNMGVAQDLGTVLGAAELLRGQADIRWILLGDGRVRAWLESEVRRRDLSQTVLFLGSFPPERMPAFFAHADVLLSTLADDEIFALTVPSRIQSYLASGRPVIAAMNGEGARIIAEAEAGLACPPSDPARLAEVVTALYRMPREERHRMARSARQYFQREFDRDVVVDRLDGYLRMAIG